jgi:hypothetical protein
MKNIFETIAQATKPTFYTYKIYQNNELKKTFEDQVNDLKVLGYMLSAQSNSMDHALKYEGWKIEIINQETNEKEYMKPWLRFWRVD